MQNEYKSLLTDLNALRAKHAETLHHADVFGTLNDLIDDTQFSLESLADDLVIDGTTPLTAAEYSTVWNKQEAGTV